VFSFIVKKNILLLLFVCKVFARFARFHFSVLSKLASNFVELTSRQLKFYFAEVTHHDTLLRILRHTNSGTRYIALLTRTTRATVLRCFGLVRNRTETTVSQLLSPPILRQLARVLVNKSIARARVRMTKYPGGFTF
jgi:hypothetical protein